MIKIDDEYIINANENCYTLEKIGKIEDISSQNFGKETRTIQGYYTTIENALNGYIKSKIRKFVAKETNTDINELILEINKLKNYMNLKMEEI